MDTKQERVRLQKYLANQGIASRRAAEKLIQEGMVRVNGQLIREMGVKIDPTQDQVTVGGQLVRSGQRMRYILLHKPVGYICSVRDERGRRTVLDLVSDIPERVYPVGRLDYDTSGLLLLTNDGELTQRLLHPSGEVDKTYLAEVRGSLSRSTAERLARGVRLSDGLTAPARVRIVRHKADSTLVELTIHEGRNRQVRRMLEAVGHPVWRLKRLREGGLDLQGLAVGQWRELTDKEVQTLKDRIGDSEHGR